jgi:2',3'-cyclic-nucleotide 2'-phosphodiesterase (5'-nucleotidase family)
MADNYRGTPLFKDSDPLSVADPFVTAASEVDKLKKDCDIIIALAYMSPKEVEKLASNVTGITLILHSHNGMHYATSDAGADQPYTTGNTLVVHTPDGGRLVGVLELAAVDGSYTFKERIMGSSFEQKTEETRKLLIAQGSTYLNTFFSLGAEIQSDIGVQAILDEIEPIINAYTDSLVIARE